MQTKKLIMVTSQNNNKYYNFTDNGDGTFTAEFGRVGASSQKKKYPLHRWNSIYNQKLAKGYRDVTSLQAASKTSSFHPIADPSVRQLMQKLQRCSSLQIEENYTISTSAVTQAMIDDAQWIIDQQLMKSIHTLPKHQNTHTFNQHLLNLFQTLPRKMKQVNDHLLDDSQPFDIKRAKQIISNEQDLLDNMTAQVGVQSAQQQKDEATDKQQTLLDVLGITVEPTDPIAISALTDILKQQGVSQDRVKSIFSVESHFQTERFSQHLNQNTNNPAVKYLWHGSRSENWISILKSGLLIRPANAVKTGAMFGNGIYFSSKFQKSLGYTSTRGAYWTGGSASSGYMAIYGVHVGNSLVAKRHESWMYSLDYDKLRRRGSYDSLHAPAGADLRNDETIIYRIEQCHPVFLLEVQ